MPRPALDPRNPANWGVDLESHALASNADVCVNRDRVGRVSGVWREDVFGRLYARGKDAGAWAFTQPDLDAVRRLQRDLAIRGRVAGGGGSERVDGGSGEPGSGLDNAVAASRRVDAVKSKLDPRVWALLSALCDPHNRAPWRETVVRLTAVTTERAQVRAVKRASRALADAYGYTQPVERGSTLGQMNARRAA